MTCVDVSKDNKYFIAGSNDKSINIWERETGRIIKTLKGHNSRVTSVVFSNDMKYIISSSCDKSIKI